MQSFPGITKLRAAERKQQVKLAHSRSHSASLLLGIPFRSAELHRISRSRQTDLDARDSFSAAQFSVAHHSRLLLLSLKAEEEKSSLALLWPLEIRVDFENLCKGNSWIP